MVAPDDRVAPNDRVGLRRRVAPDNRVAPNDRVRRRLVSPNDRVRLSSPWLVAPDDRVGLRSPGLIAPDDRVGRWLVAPMIVSADALSGLLPQMIVLPFAVPGNPDDRVAPNDRVALDCLLPQMIVFAAGLLPQMIVLALGELPQMIVLPLAFGEVTPDDRVGLGICYPQ